MAALLRQGFSEVRAVDIKPLNPWFQTFPQADNRSLDLREKDTCYRALEGADHVYNLAADMGGMGFIERDCVERVAWNVHRSTFPASIVAERFEDLRAWQTARTLTNEVYAVTKRDPFQKDWALKDQIRRAAISVMSNVAEGFESRTRARFIDFLVFFEINRRMLQHLCSLPKPGCQGLELTPPAFEENAARTAEEAERSEILHCLTERSEGV